MKKTAVLLLGLLLVLGLLAGCAQAASSDAASGLTDLTESSASPSRTEIVSSEDSAGVESTIGVESTVSSDDPVGDEGPAGTTLLSAVYDNSYCQKNNEGKVTRSICFAYWANEYSISAADYRYDDAGRLTECTLIYADGGTDSFTFEYFSATALKAIHRGGSDGGAVTIGYNTDGCLSRYVPE